MHLTDAYVFVEATPDELALREAAGAAVSLEDKVAVLECYKALFKLRDRQPQFNWEFAVLGRAQLRPDYK